MPHSVLNVKAVVAAFNQEKALVGAFSVIVKLHQLIVNSSNHKYIRSGSIPSGVTRGRVLYNIGRPIIAQTHLTRVESSGCEK